MVFLFIIIKYNKRDMEDNRILDPSDLEKASNKDTNKFSSDKKKNGKVKYILNIVAVLVFTGVAVGITFATDSDNIIKTFQGVEWPWLLACIGLVVGAMFFRSLIYLCFARLYTKKYHLHQAVALDQIGTFYNGVTPGSSGGQFMQAYTYKKQGLPISAGASIMVMTSIIYQVTLIIYGILALCIKNNIIVEKIPALQIDSITINGYPLVIPILPLIIIGFAINIGFIALLLSMSYSKKFHHFILGPFISLLNKIKLVKNPDEARENLRIQVENFKIELKRLLSNIPFSILIFFFYFIVMTLSFSVPCFAGKALGATYDISWSTFWDAVFYSNFHQMVTGLIPIPGSAGVSEYFFNQLFNNYFGLNANGVSITSAAQLLWRLDTFTLPLLIGGLVSAFYRASPTQEALERGGVSRKTFVALQRETYIERKESADTLYETTRLTRAAILSSLKIRNKQEKEEQRRKKEEQKKQEEMMQRISRSETKDKKIDTSNWDSIDVTSEDE